MSASVALPDELLDALAQRVSQRVVEHLDATLGNRGKGPYFSVDEAAEYLGCPRSRIYALTAADRMPHFKEGSRTLFRLTDLDAWVEQGGGIRP